MNTYYESILLLLKNWFAESLVSLTLFHSKRLFSRAFLPISFLFNMYYIQLQKTETNYKPKNSFNYFHNVHKTFFHFPADHNTKQENKNICERGPTEAWVPPPVLLAVHEVVTKYY